MCSIIKIIDSTQNRLSLPHRRTGNFSISFWWQLLLYWCARPTEKKSGADPATFYWKRHDINYKRLSNGKTYRFLDEVVYLYSVHRYSWWNGSQRRRRERATRFCCCVTIWLAVSIFIWVSCSHDAFWVFFVSFKDKQSSKDQLRWLLHAI